MRRVIALVLMLFAVAGAARADEFDEVRTALHSGDYDTAYADLVRMGDAGDTLAMVMLANLGLPPTNLTSGLEFSAAWLEQAADQSNVHAMLLLGQYYGAYGSRLIAGGSQPAIATGSAEAAALFGQAAQLGSVDALTQLADLPWTVVAETELPISLGDDPSVAARTLVERAIEGGSRTALFGLAGSPLVRDEPSLVGALMREAARLGDLRALGRLITQPDRYGVTDPVDVLAWTLAARAAWTRGERAPILLLEEAWAVTPQDLAERLDGAIAAATPEVRVPAQARADEIAAGWVSYMPGQVTPDSNQGLDIVRSALDAGDYETAYAVLAQRAADGDTLAALLLAGLAISPVSGSQDLDLANAWLSRAADEGNLHALLVLGRLYEFGGLKFFPERREKSGVAGYPEALELYLRAADAGSTAAMARVGLLYSAGGLSREWQLMSLDEEERLARSYLERAAEAGHANAIMGLAILQAANDREAGLQLYRRAARAGDVSAIRYLLADPERFGVTDPVEQLAWVLVARTISSLVDPTPAALMVAFDTRDPAEFDAILAETVAAAPPGYVELAQPIADEITADWVTYLPGTSQPR